MAAHDVQNGFVLGADMTFDKQKTYVWTYIGGSLGQAEVNQSRDNNTQSRTILGGVSVTKGFMGEAESVISLNGARSLTTVQRVAQPTVTTTALVHSNTKTDYYSANTQLAYKFKWKNNVTQKTYFSMRPYVGLQGYRVDRYAYTERDGGALNITHGRLGYNSVDAQTGLGIRHIATNEKWSLKSTLNLGISRNLNNPRVVDHLFFDGAPASGMLSESANTGRTTYSAALTMTVTPKDANWKVSAVVQHTAKSKRSTDCVTLRYTLKF
jgi:Autotransporter beta-domain